MTELTKESLKGFLDKHPALTPRAICLEAGLNENYINQLYNKSGRNLTETGKEKILSVLVQYGWK